MSRSPLPNPKVNLLKTSKRQLLQTILFGPLMTSLVLVPMRAAESISGMVGVGTWVTQAEFKDMKVTRGGQTLFESDFTKGKDEWKTWRGKWEVVEGALRQTGNEEDARAVAGDSAWSEYTLTLKARKLGGNEGFLILFGLPTPDSPIKSWWNLGGWGNTAHGIQAPGVPEERKPGRIENNRWYDIKIELSGNTIRAYLDGQFIQSAEKPSDATAQREFPHALIPDLLADPSIAEFDGTFYLYGTTDGMGQGLATSGLPVVWKSKDFLNWSFDGSIFPLNFDAKYWAPSAPVKKDNRIYLFPTLDNRITVVVSRSPDGPFRTLDGKDITKTSGWKHFPIDVGHPIDAEIFRDDDGSYYMVWSQRFMAKMNRDFTGFEARPIEIRTKRGGYSEGPQIIKRNGIYYYLYTLGGSEGYQYAYMMSRKSVLGPWEGPDQDIISTTDYEKGIYGPGHGCFFKPEGSQQWYFVYLEYGRSGTNRQAMAAKMDFNPDGTIKPIELTLEGVGAIRPDPRYSTPNLALNKKATASSTRPEVRIPPINDQRLNRIETFGPDNALDGSNGSRWMAEENDSAAWYQLDLGEEREIKRTELYFVKPTAGHAYRLEFSGDGNTWQPYGGHDDIRVQSPHTDVKSVRARYLRVSFFKGVPGLWEFRVY
jgi:Glycosyl hydrolases family 43/F5/8 type C domain